MARGSPSRRRTMRADEDVVGGQVETTDRGPGPLDEEAARRAPRRQPPERRDGPHVLAVDAEPLAARGEDPDGRPASQQELDGAGRFADDVLGVVEHHQHVEVAGPSQRLRARRLLARQPELGHHRRRDVLAVVERASTTILTPAPPRRRGPGDLEGQAGLANAAGAHQRHDAGGVEQVGHLLPVDVAAHEGGRGEWRKRGAVGRRAARPVGAGADPARRTCRRARPARLGEGGRRLEPGVGQRLRGPSEGAKRLGAAGRCAPSPSTSTAQAPSRSGSPATSASAAATASGSPPASSSIRARGFRRPGSGAPPAAGPRHARLHRRLPRRRRCPARARALPRAAPPPGRGCRRPLRRASARTRRRRCRRGPVTSWYPAPLVASASPTRDRSRDM